VKKSEVEAFDAKKLVVVALVLYRLVAVNPVDEPLVITADAAKRLVVEAVVAKKLVVVALVAKKLAAVNPVVEAFVSTEVEAKMLEVKTLRNRREDDPREKVASEDGVMLPAT
jgi:hypothetical protein